MKQKSSNMKKENLKQERPLSYSALKSFQKSPNHLVGYWNKVWEPTPAMLKGTLVHTLILEPETFDDLYFVIDDAKICGELTAMGAKSPRAKGEYKTWLKELKAKNEGKTEIKPEVFAEVNALAQKALAVELPGPIYATEKLIEFEFNGQPFKGFVDAIGSNYIMDVKTTADASPAAFARDVYKMKYHWQAALYQHAANELDLAGGHNPDFYIVAVETTAPFNVQLYKMSAELIDLGTAEVNKSVRDFKLWDGQAAGYEFYDLLSVDGVMELNPPSWV